MGRYRTIAVITLVVGGVTIAASGLGYLALTVDTEERAQDRPGTVSVPGTVQQLHSAGITGENVTVGVLDVTGFDTDQSALADSVVESRAFDGSSAVSAGETAHGTKTAVSIAELAPDATLYLGTFQTPAEYATALEWMVAQGVDVVVVPVAYAGTLGDGESKLSRATTNATEQGVAVVAPSGNLGRSHWLGEYRPTGDGVHVFGDDTLNRITGPTGRAEFWLTTDASTGEYRLELHELTGDNQTELVAQSVAYESGVVHSERLTVRLDDGRYALVVRGPATDTDAQIRVASSTHELAERHPAGSVTAPAVASGAISVGAYDPATNRTELFSSRGPTTDGRLGVHIVAPSTLTVPGVGTYTGTSAGATYAGGIVALLLDANPELVPTEIRRILTSTAEPIDGVNSRSGHGRVDTVRAVEQARASADNRLLSVSSSSRLLKSSV